MGRLWICPLGAHRVGFESYLVASPRRCLFWIMALIIWATPVKERRWCWVNRLIGERWRSVPLQVTKQWITATRSALSIISFLPFILLLSSQPPVPPASKELKKNTNESCYEMFFFFLIWSYQPSYEVFAKQSSLLKSTWNQTLFTWNTLLWKQKVDLSFKSLVSWRKKHHQGLIYLIKIQ